MSKVDIGLYIQGRNKIQRLRGATDSVINNVYSLLESALSFYKWKKKQKLIEIRFNKYVFAVFHRENGIFRSEIQDENGNDTYMFSHGVDKLPWRMVPAVYEMLPILVEELDIIYPHVGLGEHFEFYEKQAK